MKGKITERGSLMIERRGRIQSQYCPYTEFDPCGDQCPLFGEPYTNYDGTFLRIYNDRTLVFDEFTDERGTE